MMNCMLSNIINVKIWRLHYVKETLGISFQFFFNISISFFKIFWTFPPKKEKTDHSLWRWSSQGLG